MNVLNLSQFTGGANSQSIVHTLSTVTTTIDCVKPTSDINNSNSAASRANFRQEIYVVQLDRWQQFLVGISL